MPKKRTKADRYELFRSFLRNLIQTAYQTKGHTKKASGGKSNALSEAKMLNEIEAAFKEFKRLGFPDSNEYQTWLKPFSYWLFTHEAQRMRNQRRIAAKARWGKKGGTGGESKTS